MSEATNPDLRAAVVQDARTQRVLMLGYMDAEAERLTRDTGEVHFYSRSRGRLWRKGETSGHVLHVESLEPDCDGDALLIGVRPDGPSCHVGTTSCFAPWLWRRINERASADPAESYVARTLGKGVGFAAQKVGEEAVETVIAALGETDERFVSEAADLFFHLLLLLRARGVDVADIEEELRHRSR